MGGLIDRQAAIDRIRGTGYADQIKENVIMILMGLPSAQPETNCSEIPNNSDTISRQAAIDALRTCYETETVTMDDGDEYINYEDAVGEIEQLPSAQPEIIRCKDCRYGVNFYRDGECYCSNPKYELRYFGGSWEFYCADAERRTDGSD